VDLAEDPGTLGMGPEGLRLAGHLGHVVIVAVTTDAMAASRRRSGSAQFKLPGSVREFEQ
jgi:hypothetical protein